MGTEFQEESRQYFTIVILYHVLKEFTLTMQNI